MSAPRTPLTRPEGRLFTLVGARLRDHRADKGLTIRDVARDLGVGVATAHRLEAGTDVPSSLTLLRALEYLGFDATAEICNQLHKE